MANWTPSVIVAQAKRAKASWGKEIAAAEQRHGLAPGLVYAVGSRETNLRNIVGDAGHGHGVWQLDDRSQVIPYRSPSRSRPSRQRRSWRPTTTRSERTVPDGATQ